MKFKVKVLPLRSEKFCVLMNSEDSRDLGILPGDRVKVVKGKKSFVAEVEIADFVNKGEIGVCSFTAESCKVDECVVEVYPITRYESVEYIRKKLDGFRYTREQIRRIILDLASNVLSDVELSAFVLANEILGMDTDEIGWFTEALVETGEKLTFEKGTVVNTHSIGGVPGNRYSMVTVPVLASSGLIIPKTASRAITSASGTADTMEVLANVNLSVDEIKEICEKVNGVIALSAKISPVDEKIIRMEHQLEISPKPNLVASLSAKIVGSGAKFVTVDLPVGAKINNVDDARILSLNFIEIGRRFGVEVGTVISDGSQPLCKAVGPALEAKEVLKAFEEKKFEDFVVKGIEIASILMEFSGIASNGYEMARNIFESGKAHEKFLQIIEAQGGEILRSEDVPIGDKKYTITSKKEGYVQKIDVKAINAIARAAGAPKDKGAGVYLHKKKGDVVKRGDPIITIYSEKDWKLDSALEIASEKKIVEISGVVLETRW
ncbi:MAG: AMP phosphorylase [Archaeoglobaceae archaeon]|nr:AMP phosphorylase [Archaeoglobaceae archaeon]MCX8151868.1 AMP phosphorylase [Archaeoglobaceae archaeon]MDW8014300.1 AMP phosphorylase [Archaeoglobaceae archaeon]